MKFFQRMGNALARFMYGRNGADQLGMALLGAALAVDLVNTFFRTANPLVYGILNVLSTVILVYMVFRMLSKNLSHRRGENAWFLQKIWWPIRRGSAEARQRAQDKEHKYFTCPSCGTVCRVPRGKGKIVITCPKCRREIRGKS